MAFEEEYYLPEYYKFPSCMNIESMIFDYGGHYKLSPKEIEKLDIYELIEFNAISSLKSKQATKAKKID